MTTGTGLFVFGAWLVVVAAYATDRVTETGVNKARKTAWIATLIGVSMTILDKFV